METRFILHFLSCHMEVKLKTRLYILAPIFVVLINFALEFIFYMKFFTIKGLFCFSLFFRKRGLEVVQVSESQVLY